MFRKAAFFILLAGCAGAGRPAPTNTVPPTHGSPPGIYLTRAEALEKHGAHLEASLYFEAAIAAGGVEIEVLPSVIAAQVRAGRLRAARLNLARLAEMKGEDVHTDALFLLLDRWVPMPERRAGPVVETEEGSLGLAVQP